MINLWGYDISSFVWFFAAGQSFFPGVGLLIIAMILARPGRKGRIFISCILLVIAAFMIILSVTPLPAWFYALWAGSVLCSFFLLWYKSHAHPIMGKLARGAAIGLSVIAVFIELPFHFQQSIKKGEFERMYIVGDSISAGIGGKDERPWPRIFRDKYGIEVIDLSMAGATVTSALKQASQIDRPDAIVFIEIGGNDLFGNTPYDRFEESLSQILRKATESGRLTVMLELPLRSRDVQYGRIQRRLAKKYEAVLVPKHFFAGIFATKGATVDLVHLSQAGHQLMAGRVWNLLKDSLRREVSKAERLQTSQR